MRALFLYTAIAGFSTAVRVRRRSNADVLVPKLGMVADEGGHEIDALLILDHLDRDALGSEVVFSAEKRSVLADNNMRDFVEHDCAAAHGTGRERRIQSAVAIHRGRKAARVAKAVHLAVIDGAAGLDPAIVAASDDFSFVDQNASDGYAAFAEAFVRLFNSGCEKFADEHIPILFRECRAREVQVLSGSPRIISRAGFPAKAASRSNAAAET